MTISLGLRCIAIVCFILAIFNVPWPSIQMIALGLTAWVGSTLP